MIGSATLLRDAAPPRRPSPPLALEPRRRIARDDIQAKAAERVPAVAPWPQLTGISPELIAYHKRRAHRLRSRALRRTLYRTWRRVAVLVPRFRSS